MSRILITCFITLFIGSKAQDTLYFRTSEKVAVKIVEINPDDIKYKTENNPDGPTYSALKTEIKQIVFATGLIEKFDASQQQQAPVSQLSVSGDNTGYNMYKKGKADAFKYFNPGGAKTVTGIAS